MGKERRRVIIMGEETFCYIGLSILILMFRLPFILDKIEKKRWADEDNKNAKYPKALTRKGNKKD